MYTVVFCQVSHLRLLIEAVLFEIVICTGIENVVPFAL